MQISSSLIGLVAVICCLGGPFICGIVGIICSTVEKISRQRADANLKQIMLQRGFTAADIERVCNTKVQKNVSSSTDVSAWQPIPPAKPARV
jgi:hypothetical protein